MHNKSQLDTHLTNTTQSAGFRPDKLFHKLLNLISYKKINLASIYLSNIIKKIPA